MYNKTLRITASSVAKLRHELVVSCQASRGEPMCSPEHIAALARSAINGGASGLRLEGADNVAYLRRLVDVPIIALTKEHTMSEKRRMECVYITPTFEDAAQLARAGADIIALDATARPRPDGSTFAELAQAIRKELQLPVWADVARFEEGLAAAVAGADVVSTTLSGYTSETAATAHLGPDIELLRSLVKALDVPVVLEGKVWHPEEVTAAFQAGAYAVVVGSAITRPQLITRRFVEAIPERETRND